VGLTVTNTRGRRLLSLLETLFIAVGLFAYVWSFWGAPVDPLVQFEAVLVVVALGLSLPIYIREYPASKSWRFPWPGFTQGMPVWVTPCARLLMVIFALQLVWTLFRWREGVPVIIDGKFALGSNGRIGRILTHDEYRVAKADELRLATLGLINFCFLPATYWWYRRDK
jgi:hypothetical protein